VAVFVFDWVLGTSIGPMHKGVTSIPFILEVYCSARVHEMCKSFIHTFSVAKVS